jgi:hypothetical protein
LSSPLSYSSLHHILINCRSYQSIAGPISIVVDGPTTPPATSIATIPASASAPTLARAKTAARAVSTGLTTAGTAAVEAAQPGLARARTSAVNAARDVSIAVEPVRSATLPTLAHIPIQRTPSPSIAAPKPSSGPDPFHAVKEYAHPPFPCSYIIHPL